MTTWRTEQAAWLAGMSRKQASREAQTYDVRRVGNRGDMRWAFPDVVALRVAVALRRGRAPSKVIRPAMDVFRELDLSEQDLRSMLAAGKRALVAIDGAAAIVGMPELLDYHRRGPELVWAVDLARCVADVDRRVARLREQPNAWRSRKEIVSAH